MRLLLSALLLLGISLHAENKFPSDSLFHLKGKWSSTSGSKGGLEQLAGKPIILSLVYTRCKASCPLTIAKMTELEKAAGAGPYQFVMASFDPTHDTVEALKKYVVAKKLAAQKWQMLSPASDPDVRELAAAIGVSYEKDDQGEYSHSNVIVLLDAQGTLRAKLDGLNSDTSDFIKILKKLSHAS